MSQELEKICNIAGYPMYPWASDQLKLRSAILSKSNRSEEEINYLGNKGAWIRVVSSVNLEKPFIKYFEDEYGLKLDESDLAKNFVLFGGTSIYQSKTNNLLRSGIDTGGSYAILGSKEVKEYGYRPMPGITAMTIESTGRMGSLRQATVNFRVSDKMQLDVMDALYFRPGFSVLIEYGHAKYINNDGKLKSTEELMIDPFPTKTNTKIKTNKDKEDIGIEISRNIQKSAGNYGGLLSIITSFNFSMTPDGGYDCVLKTIALGGVMGNYPINKLETLPAIYIKQLKAFLDRQRAADEAAERKAAEDAAKEELKNLQKTVNDNWADLRITKALPNLIYNIDRSELASALVVGPSPGGYTNTAAANFLLYKKDLVDKAVDVWKINHLVKNQDSREIVAYGKDNTIFIEKSFSSNTSNKYLTDKNNTKQNGDIYINIDPSSIFSTLENNDTRIKALSNRFAPGPEPKNWFDAVAPTSITSATGTTNSVSPTFRGVEFINDDIDSRRETTVEYTYRGIRYSISLSYDIKLGNAKEIYNNATTKWKVVRVNANVPYIELETDEFPTYTLSIGSAPPAGATGANIGVAGDLRFISNIEGNQDLAKNKAADQAIEIERRIATQLQDIKNRYQLETDAKTLQALASSQSAIELMLRSISLYAISAQKPDVVLDDKFIKDLFSEGAYSKIFKQISSGRLPTKTYTQADFTRYINGTMNAKERLEVNLRYGNSAYLMSAENTSDNVNLLEIIPQVELANLFKVKQLPYGEKADILVDGAPKVSIYISLGLFLMMLNHCSMLYNKGKEDDTVVPLTYVDFNPSTNYYLSSINQFSVDPFSFIMPYYGNDTTYKKLFKPGIINSNNQIELKISGSSIQPHSIFKFSNDRLSKGLLNNKLGLSGGNSDGYIGRTMDTLVNINFLLKIIKDYSTSSDYGETYFQSVLENTTAALNKSTGYYNAFRLAYNDGANAYMIVDDQIQVKPDSRAQSLQYDIINPSTSTLASEIPIQGKGSIARSFEIRTDISNRISSMLAISTNTGAGAQVGMGKNMGDFGVYNTGSYDRYMPVKTSDSSSIAPQNNVQDCQAAINFDTVVATIYGLSSDQSKEIISTQQIQNAMAYYKDRMARVKNEQPLSVSAMIIPIRTTITMDGFSGMYPFQLFTVNESVLPYRYSSANLNNGKVAFTTTKITHNFSNNEWITSMDGLMTFLKNSTDGQETKNIEQGPIEVSIVSGANVTFTNVVANSKEIYDFFIAQGFTNFQAAAWVGNLYQESGLNPTADESGGDGYGLAQWTIPSRKNPLITRPNYKTLQVQLDYIIEELNSSAAFKAINNEIKATTNISDATLTIRTKYEMPLESAANDAVRLAYAEFIFEKFNKI
jgi:hypothetical protein